MSNMYEAHFEWEGIVYTTVEAAYQSAKTLDMDERKKIATMNPVAARSAGRRLQLRPNWDNIRVSVMQSILVAKFEQNTILAKRLVDTGDALLEESNNYGDTFWGVCNGEGENYLGRLLMHIRSYIAKLNVNWSQYF